MGTSHLRFAHRRTRPTLLSSASSFLHVYHRLHSPISFNFGKGNKILDRIIIRLSKQSAFGTSLTSDLGQIRSRLEAVEGLNDHSSLVCCSHKVEMATKSDPRTLSVYLYIPNIIGYLRVLMNCFAFAICFSNKELFSILYFVSFVCDALDGWFARKFNQVSTFGAVMDMITDRISTTCLLAILSRVYRPSFMFLSLISLDIASHWLQMYSTSLVGKANYKDVKDSTSWLFKLYYGNRKFMGFCCIACEVLYIVLFLLAMEQSQNITDVLLGAAQQSIIYSALIALILFGWATKQLINVIQMKTAADLCVLYDLNKQHNV